MSKEKRVFPYPLETATIGFLLAPHYLFFWGWLNTVWAVIATVALSLILLMTIRAFRKGDEDLSGGYLPLRPKYVIIALVVAIVWSLLSGAAGIGHQNGDWRKHNAVLKELVTHPWPVGWPRIDQESEVGDYRLVYYLGYYLIPASIGKFAGWMAANISLLLTNIVGSWLVLLWFGRLVQARSARTFCFISGFFILASGLDIVGCASQNHMPKDVISHLERWAGSWSYPCNTTQLFWAPQHALSGWLCTSLVLSQFLFKRRRLPLVLPLVAALVWSPFMVIGLAPLVVHNLIRLRPPDLKEQACSAALAMLLLVIFVSFYMTAQYSIPKAVYAFSLVPKMFLFFTLEVGLYLLILWHFLWLRNDDATSPDRVLMGMSAVVLFFILFFKVGHYNDLSMRCTLPYIFILWVMVARRLITTPTTTIDRCNYVCLSIVVLISCITPLVEVARSILQFRIQMPKIQRVPPVFRCDIDEVNRQYTGKVTEQVLFYRLFGKEAELPDVQK